MDSEIDGKKVKDVGRLKGFALRSAICEKVGESIADSEDEGIWVLIGKWYELGRETKYGEKWGHTSRFSRNESVGDIAKYPR